MPGSRFSKLKKGANMATWYLTAVEKPTAPSFYTNMYESLNSLVKTFDKAGEKGYIIKSDLDFYPGPAIMISVEIFHRQFNDPNPLYREFEMIFNRESTPEKIAQRLEILNFKIKTQCRLD